MEIIETRHESPAQVKTTRKFRTEGWAYIKNPTYRLNNSPVSGPVWLQIWRMFKAIFLFVLAAGVLSIVIISPIEKRLGIDLRQHHNIKDWWLLIITFTLIPLLEETIFRLPLRPTVGKVCFFMVGLSIEVAFLINHKLPEAWQYPTIGVLGVVGIGVGVCLSIFREQIYRFWQRHFRWVFYGIALLFSFLHLSNSSTLTGWHIAFALVITLPQLVMGLYFGYVRMVYGFWYAVAMHAMNNFIPACIIAVKLMAK